SALDGKHTGDRGGGEGIGHRAVEGVRLHGFYASGTKYRRGLCECGPRTLACVDCYATHGLEPNLDVLVRIDVDAVDETNAMRVILHDDRAGANAFAEKPHAFHERAVGHAGRREDDLPAGREILRPVDLP